MAVSISTVARLTDNTLGYTIKGDVSSTDTTGNHQDRRRFTIGTSEETVTINSDVTGGSGPGWCIITNHDATNYVEVGPATTVYSDQLDAGTSVLKRLPAGATQLFLKANTAACEVTIDVRER